MTIDELKTRLKQINPDLKLDVDLDDQPMGVWYEPNDPFANDLQLFRIDENDYYFEPIINEIYEANSLIGSDTVKAVGDLLFEYFEPKLSKESQKISKDSKNVNGSTAAFSKPASKDSQKKTMKYKIKYFNESEYEDLSDTYARMEDAVNKFCSDHNVVTIETTQNGDEDLVTVVTYKELQK